MVLTTFAFIVLISPLTFTLLLSSNLRLQTKVVVGLILLVLFVVIPLVTIIVEAAFNVGL